MALINCRGCGHLISEKALRCPKCGYTNQMECNDSLASGTGGKKGISKSAIMMLVLVTLVILGAASFYYYRQNIFLFSCKEKSGALVEYGLTGNVKTVKEKVVETWSDGDSQTFLKTYQFSKTGKIKSFLDSNNNEIEYDGLGRIVKEKSVQFNKEATIIFTYEEQDGGNSVGLGVLFDGSGYKEKLCYNSVNQLIYRIVGDSDTTEYVYKNGLLMQETVLHDEEGMRNKVYTYDNNGLATSCCGWAGTTTYTYQEFDKEGNWIERSCQFEGEGVFVTKETRSIEYWEEKKK